MRCPQNGAILRAADASFRSSPSAPPIPRSDGGSCGTAVPAVRDMVWWSAGPDPQQDRFWLVGWRCPRLRRGIFPIPGIPRDDARLVRPRLRTNSETLPKMSASWSVSSVGGGALDALHSVYRHDGLLPF